MRFYNCPLGCDKNQTFTAEDNGWGMGYIITIETLWEERDNYLQDNKLRLQIQLDILGELVNNVKTPGTGLLIQPRANVGNKRKRHHKGDWDEGLEQDEVEGFAVMRRDMKKLFKSHHDTDIMIECGKKSFPVHKLILSGKEQSWVLNLVVNFLTSLLFFPSCSSKQGVPSNVQTRSCRNQIADCKGHGHSRISNGTDA